MLGALIACGFVCPLLALYITANDDAIALLAAIHNNLSRLAPDLNIYCIVDVVALLILAFHDAATKVSDHGAAVKAAQCRIRNNANDAGCVK